MRIGRRVRIAIGMAAAVGLGLGGAATAAAGPAGAGQGGGATATPIHHVVVIFQENVSFDHYFGTYPHATNPKGEPKFVAAPGTPSVNGLTRYLMTHNPNLANPFRLDRSQPMTCDMNHGYTAEQKATNGGLLNQFVQDTGATYTVNGVKCDPKQVMGYYDGNTVTALWNYAQHFSLADESFDTTFGPSTPGALNLIGGQTYGATPSTLGNHTLNGTLFNDTDPTYDACSGKTTVAMSGSNVGEVLTAKHITWGWFQGGFTPTSRTASGAPVCGSAHKNVGGQTITDYIPHHEPFQYFKATANPNHLPPSSTAMIGHTDQANHQYGLRSFWAAADAGNLPAVSFLKAPGYQDGHPGYSDPLDEQTFLVNTINRLEKLPSWKSTAVVITWDDSDGWYDHVMPPIVNQSNTTLDALTGGSCGTATPGSYEARCGYGPRIPVLVISPYARVNYVYNRAMASQASILRFIEDNWHLGRLGNQSYDAMTGSIRGMFDFTHPAAHRLFLNPSTGEPVAASANAMQSPPGY